MKRTTSLILCLVLSISLFAQSRGVTFQVHNETLTSVLKKIEKAGEKNILFAYQATDQYRVTANIQAKRQKEALEMVLQGKSLLLCRAQYLFCRAIYGQDDPGGTDQGPRGG